MRPALRRVVLRAQRTPAAATLLWVRAGMALLEHVAPERGGAWAERLFFRVPPTPPAARRARPVPSGGVPVAVELDGRTVRGVVWGREDAPLVVLLHGWGGWWQQLSAYVEPLLRRHHRVLAFDALGHGSSDATRHSFGTGRIPEFADCLAAVAERFGQPAGVVAHSGGAMAVMLATADGRLTPQRLVFVGASVRISDIVAFIRGIFGIGSRAAQVMLRRVEARIERSAADFDTVAMAGGLQRRGVLPEMLLIHDRDDADAPLAGADALHAGWPGSRLVVTEGLGHRRPLWMPALVEQAVDFLTGGLAARDAEARAAGAADPA